MEGFNYQQPGVETPGLIIINRRCSRIVRGQSMVKTELVPIVNGENRMEGLVCWSNYGGNGSLYTQKSGGLGRCLAGHETPRNRPETGCTSVDKDSIPRFGAGEVN